MATRDPDSVGRRRSIAPHIALGASPRATLGLIAAGRALARAARPALPRAAGRLRRRARDPAPPVDPHVRRARRRRLADDVMRAVAGDECRSRRSRPRQDEPPATPASTAAPAPGTAPASRTGTGVAAVVSEGGRAAPPRAPRDAAARRLAARRVPRRADRARAREFAGARQYEAGDDARRIDWNLTARSLTPQLRTTEADRELQTWVVVDRSASMDFGTAEREKSRGRVRGERRVRASSPRGTATASACSSPAATASPGSAPPRRAPVAAGDAVARSTTCRGAKRPARRRRRPRRRRCARSSARARAAARSSWSPTSSTTATGSARCARLALAPPGPRRPGRRPPRARAPGGGHAGARRRRDRPPHRRAVELGRRCASATPTRRANAHDDDRPQASARPVASHLVL